MDSNKINQSGRMLVNRDDRSLYKSTIGKYGVWTYLELSGVALRNDHFVFTKGGHGDVYINIRDLDTVQKLIPVAMQMAWEVRNVSADAVVGTPHGADTLAVLVAYYYSLFARRKITVLKLLNDGNNLKWYKDNHERVRDVNVLQIEDLINTGGSLLDTARFIKESSGNLIGFVAVCNRISDKNPGLDFFAKELDIDCAIALASVEAKNYAVNIDKNPQEQCPLCAEGKKVNLRVGHGSKFLSQIEELYPNLFNQLK